jgi:hypothetical protein
LVDENQPPLVETSTSNIVHIENYLDAKELWKRVYSERMIWGDFKEAWFDPSIEWGRLIRGERL